MPQILWDRKTQQMTEAEVHAILDSSTFLSKVIYTKCTCKQCFENALMSAGRICNTKHKDPFENLIPMFTGHFRVISRSNKYRLNVTHLICYNFCFNKSFVSFIFFSIFSCSHFKQTRIYITFFCLCCTNLYYIFLFILYQIIMSAQFLKCIIAMTIGSLCLH